MKVLFAVSNESISEAIIKKYQQMYKEIISSKNVYYFNAIIKELQKDKSYDRIVISEDLEPFASKNYDTIDNFLFEKLDSISDEASKVQGEDIPIILISTDRRTKGENLLVKLFGIGVYSALIGQDRSIEQVCNLINKPRSKKEAKLYYKISSGEVEYKAESEGDVSEVEIQNILAHYKRLGKNEDKYVTSFNSIANQYTDQQLRLIIKFLPLNVKAVLEAGCTRYQQVVAYSSNEDADDDETKTEYKNSKSKFSKKQDKQHKVDKRAEKAGLKIESIKSEKNNIVLNKPVIIPSEVTTKNIKKVEPKVNNMEDRNENILQENQRANMQNQPMGVQRVNMQGQPMQGMQRANMQGQPMQEEQRANMQNQPMQGMQRANMQSQPIQEEQRTNVQEQPRQEVQALETQIQPVQEEKTKRGRGRPKKVLTEEEIAAQANVVKRKRGRPKKVQEEAETVTHQEVQNNYQQSNTLLELENQPTENREILTEINNFEQNTNKIQNTTNYEDDVLPGFEDYMQEKNAETLPGFDDFDVENQSQTAQVNNKDKENTLPEFNEENDNILAGFDNFEQNYNETQNSSNYVDDNMFSEFDNYNTEDEMLPGIDDYSEKDGMIPAASSENQEDGMLPGVDNYGEENDYLGANKFNLNETMSTYENQENNSFLQFNDYSGNQIESQIHGNELQEQNYNSNNKVENTQITSQNYNNVSTEGLLSGDKKIVGFVGTSKNGTSFIVDNLAQMLSNQGIKTAILDLTQNRNAYYIYTKNEEELRKTAIDCMKNLELGIAKGITVNPNLDVYTSLPGEQEEIENVQNVLATLMQKYALVLVDCDFKSDYRYIAQLQEMYLIQSMDVLTIQPLTAYLRDLKAKGILDQSKLRVVVNKYLRVRSLTEKTIIGGMAFYNDPAMSFMTELFNRETIKYTVIPFDTQAYSKYLEGLVNCEISLNGYSKEMLSNLRKLANMVYPLVTNTQKYGKEYNKKQKTQYGQYQKEFSNEMNNTLNKMKNNY